MAFWVGGDNLDPADVYARLCDQQPVNEVAAVDRERVVRAVADALPGWAWDGHILQPPEAEPDAAPAFDAGIGSQMVEFIGYGFENEHANAIIDVMHSLGYRLFDPQTGERFA